MGNEVAKPKYTVRAVIHLFKTIALGVIVFFSWGIIEFIMIWNSAHTELWWWWLIWAIIIGPLASLFMITDFRRYRRIKERDGWKPRDVASSLAFLTVILDIVVICLFILFLSIEIFLYFN